MWVPMYDSNYNNSNKYKKSYFNKTETVSKRFRYVLPFVNVKFRIQLSTKTRDNDDDVDCGCGGDDNSGRSHLHGIRSFNLFYVI